MKRHHGFLYVLVLTLFCCKKPYNPPASSSPNSYLVVEGVINQGGDSTIIKLSKTVKLDQNNVNNPVLGAVVSVESDQNASFPLIDRNNTGYYSSPGLNLSPSNKYRLHIKTAQGSEYLSDFVVVKPTPPIDSIGYTIANGNVNIYVNAHDATNSTRYYRWDYQETWQFHAQYYSDWIFDTTAYAIVVRPLNSLIYHCFGNNNSSDIVLNSTEKLSQDIIYQNPVTQFPISSEKIETKYSILVKQYALTEDAFNFYQNLKKNTESLGSIFDAQPSQLTGNIHNVNNPAESVLGYITVTNVQSKRIFLNNNILPPQTETQYPYQCGLDTAKYVTKQGNTVLLDLMELPITNIPVTAIFGPLGGAPLGFTYSSRECTDCTIRGKVDTPSFWK